MADLVEVGVDQQSLIRNGIGRILQGVTPILDLGVAGEQELHLSDLEQQDKARVVHGIVENADELEALFRMGRRNAWDEPTGSGWPGFIGEPRGKRRNAAWRS